MGGFFSFLYGLAAYAACLVTLLYLIGFSGNLLVPRSVDIGPSAPWAVAMVVDLLLVGLFAVQHSVMARRGFKRWWTRIVPPAVERSTFVVATCVVLGLLYWFWIPIEAVVWSVESTASAVVLWGLFALGWAILLFSTFLINHFELFGLHQVYARLTGRPMPEAQFRTPLLYRYVRHPIYLGLLLALWSAPIMTAGHLLFTVAVSAYVLVGIWFEERDLIAQFGARYVRYRSEAGMLLPRRGRS